MYLIAVYATAVQFKRRKPKVRIYLKLIRWIWYWMFSFSATLIFQRLNLEIIRRIIISFISYWNSSWRWAYLFTLMILRSSLSLLAATQSSLINAFFFSLFLVWLAEHSSKGIEGMGFCLCAYYSISFHPKILILVLKDRRNNLYLESISILPILILFFSKISKK